MITSILDSVMNEASIAPYVASFKDLYESLGIVIPIAIMALCLIVGFFGRRLSNVVRVVLLFAVGFIASVYWLVPMIAPMIPEDVQIPGYAIGLTAGFLAAIMSRFIYNAAYVGVIGFDVYNVCFNALILEEVTSATKGNLALSLGIAFAAVMIALALRKYAEMLVTAAAGGIGIAYFADTLLHYSETYAANFGMEPTVLMIVAGAVLAVPMFIYQYYNRVIY